MIAFGTEGILGSDNGTVLTDGVGDITVEHLLTHRGGGWQNDDRDPMYLNPNLDAKELISWVLSNRPLDRKPVWSRPILQHGCPHLPLGEREKVRVISRLIGKVW